MLYHTFGNDLRDSLGGIVGNSSCRQAENQPWLMPRFHTLKGKNQFLQVILQLPHVYYGAPVHTNTHMLTKAHTHTYKHQKPPQNAENKCAL